MLQAGPLVIHPLVYHLRDVQHSALQKYVPSMAGILC